MSPPALSLFCEQLEEEWACRREQDKHRPGWAPGGEDCKVSSRHWDRRAGEEEGFILPSPEVCTDARIAMLLALLSG